MGSNLEPICRRIQELVIDKLPGSFNVNHSDISDPWYLGPELERDIEGAHQSDRPFLNAIFLSPVESTPLGADAHGTTQEWLQTVDLYFIYPRPSRLLDIMKLYADPLHNILCKRRLRRLGDLKFKDEQGRSAGHVIGFTVFGPPDMYSEADNNALASLNLACFRIRLLIQSVVMLDPESSNG